MGKSVRPGCDGKFHPNFAWQAAMLLLLIPAETFARAGGGEGYHGGGGGGGHGGDGGGGGGIIWLIIQLLLQYPALGIPVLIVVIVLAYLYYRQQDGGSEFVVNGQRPDRGGYNRVGTTDLPTSPDWPTMIRSHDPAFDEGAFGQRVAAAFYKIQSAWCAQDLKTVRPFISDGVHERFLLQIAEQRDEGYRDFMDGLRILDLKTIEVESDGIYDEIAVRINAVSVDYRVSLTTGQRVFGSGSPEEFGEVWTFLRRRDAQTQPGKPGLIEGHCPNCGAPIEMNQSANCDHCKALLRSGQYDWVLTEITQEVEWNGVRHRQIPGVEALRRRDPDFNAAGIEDQAAVAFWRLATADRLGKVDPLRKVASPVMLKNYEAVLHPPPGQPRTFWADCAVGSVRLVGVIAGDTDDRAVVEVDWNGKRFAAQPGQPPRQTGDEALFHTVLVFCRHHDVRTEAGKGVSSAHCPNCGAPEAGGTSNACEFCGTVLTDRAHGWVLTEFLPRLDPRAQAMLNQLTRPAAPAAV